MISVVGCLMVSVVAGNLFMVSVVGCLLVSVVAGQHFIMFSVAGFSMDSAVAGGFKTLECVE